MKSLNSTVAMSAIPIGAPGWPLLACWTASIDRNRMQSAMSRRCWSRGLGTVLMGGVDVASAMRGGSLFAGDDRVTIARASLRPRLYAGVVEILMTPVAL